MVDAMKRMDEMPNMERLDSLTLEGDVRFEKDVTLIVKKHFLKINILSS